MNFKQIPLGPMQTNAYVLYNDKKEALIFDPGSDGEAFCEWLDKNDVKPLAILLTHAHFDHIGAVDAVRDHYNIDVYIHEKEADWLTDGKKNGSAKYIGMTAITARQAEHLIQKEETLSIGDFTLDILETPGHSPGSISYYDKETGTVFSGDVLFQRSIGRTDLYGGNYEQLIDSIHKKLLVLPEETIVACGHGPTTTIGDEMNGNPFLSGF